jgi:hypothetical protein
MKHVQFGLNNAKTVLEKKDKVQYVPCKKAIGCSYRHFSIASVTV